MHHYAYLSSIRFIPESPAWQLLVGKIEQAEKTIRKIARVNKAELPEKIFTEEDIAELKVIYVKYDQL